MHEGSFDDYHDLYYGFKTVFFFRPMIIHTSKTYKDDLTSNFDTRLMKRRSELANYKKPDKNYRHYGMKIATNVRIGTGQLN